MVKVTTISGVGVGEGAIESIASCRTGWTEKCSWFYNEALKRIQKKRTSGPIFVSCQGLPAWHAKGKDRWRHSLLGDRIPAGADAPLRRGLREGS